MGLVLDKNGIGFGQEYGIGFGQASGQIFYNRLLWEKCKTRMDLES